MTTLTTPPTLTETEVIVGDLSFLSGLPALPTQITTHPRDVPGYEFCLNWRINGEPEGIVAQNPAHLENAKRAITCVLRNDDLAQETKIALAAHLAGLWLVLPT